MHLIYFQYTTRLRFLVYYVQITVSSILIEFPFLEYTTRMLFHVQAVQPSAGNMVYDEFEDRTDAFSELETRLAHLQPVEVLHSSGCSRRLQQRLTDWKTYAGRSVSVSSLSLSQCLRILTTDLFFILVIRMC